MTEQAKSTYGTVLLKANDILNAIAINKAHTLTEIAEIAGLTRSTTSKILDTLQQLNYVDKDERNKSYQIGPALVKYSEAFLNDFNIVRLCRPYLLKLRDKFGETVHLGGLDNSELVYLDKFSGKKSITVMTSKIGVHAPLYATGMGKAILSTFSSDHLQAYLAKHPLLPLTDTTITDRSVLQSQLEQAQTTGLAFDNAERDEDVYCIATTITYRQKLYGAFSISIPRYRMNSAVNQTMEQEILRTKKEIEDFLANV
ncbi:IclR family transcriptional regulator [Lapidilactobacillus luobeiensis]|uniref:IclR family transcriptional regulator n=1 Tax=Lapidilactobacillus luobeiensis TaxID=2950371 RepID=UPI0021C4A3C6|nr:IclR family transcriptional regulator [Lapidilactobacillus luobeiensis]